MLHDMQDDIRKVGLRHASGDMGAWINAPKFKGFKQNPGFAHLFSLGHLP